MRGHGDVEAKTDINQGIGAQVSSLDFAARATGQLGTLVVAYGAVLGLLVAVSGCNLDLLGVEDDPSTVDAEDVQGPGAFNARFIGTQSDFSAGLDDGVTYGALFTDELTWGGSFVARQEIDLRDVPSSNDIAADEPFTTLQTAAKTSKDLKEDIADGVFGDQVSGGVNSSEFALSALLAGYSRLYMADLFCSLAFDGTGPELSSSEVWEIAENMFSEALNAENASQGVRNAARVGRARARLMLGNETGALSDAQEVPEGFEHLVQYSGVSDREENDVNDLTWDQERLSVSEEFRDLTVDDTDQEDSRVDLFFTGSTGFSGGVLQFNPNKYNDRTSPIRLASWEEAQFIIAEIQGGDEARDIINRIRARRGLPEWDSDENATAEEIRNKVIEEKARTLFMGGQRMGDLRRYQEKFGLNLFPQGPDVGSQTCMPLPDLERDNNPDL